MYSLNATGQAFAVTHKPSKAFVVPCDKAITRLSVVKGRESGVIDAGSKITAAYRRKFTVQSQVQEASDALDKVAAGERSVRVHYYRKDQNYEGWGLHISGDPAIETVWNKPLKPSRLPDSGWVHWDLQLQESGRHVELIVHKGDAKSVTCRVSEWQLYDNKGVWLLAGEQAAYFQQPNVDSIVAGDLSKSYAHWLSSDVIGWREPPSDSSGLRKFKLYWSRTAALQVASDGIHGEDGSVELTVDSSGIPYESKKKFPHLASLTALKLPSQLPIPVSELLQYQVAVAMQDANGKALDATGTQLAGVLDELFTYEGPLGVNIGTNEVDISLWAPTAQNVSLNLFEGPTSETPQTVKMTRGDTGVWTYKGPLSLIGQYYTYSVSVYCPWTQRIELSESTDPYTRNCCADSARSHIVDIHTQELKPPAWDSHVSPTLEKFTDISIYELHVRDFSCFDETVPEKLRGKYLAFAEEGSAGMNHLKRLADAGLTHIHLLPSYDFGSAPEREEDQLLPEGDLASYPPDSELQQAACLAVAERDAFNWGYDPVHYGTPEGSYATDPDSAARVIEYRTMVQSLHEAGLRVVLDVVYNHTFQSGPQGQFSVLDKVVPGYYHRREENGDVCMSTCCNNTASEHTMCERLIVDDIVHWAKSYKVDGFRFDIMGHLMLSTMQKIQTALASLTVEKDGVDGSKIYIYGEAWDFGEVAFNQRGRNASQLNITGTQMGSFNDRFRDAVMGGGPFAPSKMQGIVTGLETDPNSFTQADQPPPAQLDTLLWSSDLLRLSMAALLKDYILVDKSGASKKGKEVLYHGSTPAAYAVNPCEVVNYSSCHDNQTLFDQVMMKAASGCDIGQRTRMCMLANSLTALSQGIPFFHAADELLRSKSLDRDSYNSGDWFNKIDWTYQTNNFGVGLPVASKNDYNWPIMKPLLADTAMQPSPELIALSRDHFLEMVRIRYSSPLLRLPSSSSICSQLTFHNTGPQQVPAVLVMQLTSSDVLGMEDGTVDPNYKRIVVVVNCNVVRYSLLWPEEITSLEFHPVMENSVDPEVRNCLVEASKKLLVVAPRTTAVFVERRT